ncbi:ATP-binding protein [Priestia megaterium]|uniref:ATP-binding protein n=1 Tax=Priestia megaterium TaxID=1404 RepID=UPI001482235B|nr:ATP-binding protein [Priestia megaterium]
MLDIAKFSSTDSFEIVVEPEKNLFKELGNNSYSFLDVMSELIDNSIAAAHKGDLLEITIEIALSGKNNEKSYFIIRDNAKGIETEKLAKAISPGGTSGGKTLNEHGVGMKSAIASLGDLVYLATKTENDEKARVIQEFNFGKLEVKTADVDWYNGTEIYVSNLTDIVPKKLRKYTTRIIPYLGARYRRFLNEEKRKAKIFLKLYDADSSDTISEYELTKEVEITPIKPVYFHPTTAANEPVLENITLKDHGWEAKLTFGYAPKEEQYRSMGLDRPKNYNPYYVSLSNQGLDIIKEDRVIKFHQLSEIFLITQRHNKYNYIRGEIDLIKGFSTSIQKNEIVLDSNYLSLLKRIREILTEGEKKYLERKTYPGELPEKALRDRLVKHFKEKKIKPKKDVYPEFSVQGLGGYIDVYADGEIYEIKTQDATALDAYQLFAYMDMGKIDNGFLVAPDKKPGCQPAIDHINKHHNKNITFVPLLEEFPINHPLTEEEIEKYIGKPINFLDIDEIDN